MNPGSEDARELGCVCPVKENNSGKAAPHPPDGWWISGQCVVHEARIKLGKVSTRWRRNE